MTDPQQLQMANELAIDAPSKKYTMRISRLTIDKLGIQMYDRVSAVLAELIANAYDADATHVTISLPFGQFLARKISGQILDQGFKIIITDDGYGMTAEEVNEYYLNVGYNRRAKRSEHTPKYRRRVMGRKGIGKLAPFGICHEAEIISAGGEPTAEGYKVSNLILTLEDMANETTDENGHPIPYNPQPGSLDNTYSTTPGTKLILRRFERKRVPNREDLDRQLAARFGLRQDNWVVHLNDSIANDLPIELGTLNVDYMDGTYVRVDDSPVRIEDQLLPVSGWIAYAKDPYKDEVMAGVRLYARGKLVAQTRDFDIKTGFTGEFKMRSYLTGAIHAEWLDDREDFIRTDRQDIIWNSDRGTALRDWGRKLLKELAAKSQVSAGRRVWDIFLATSRLQERLDVALPNDPTVRRAVMSAARSLVTRTDRDHLEDPRFIERIVNLAFTVGPHRSLLDALDQIASTDTDSVDAILNLFEKARLVETYSLGQVARERVEAVEQLQNLVSDPETVEAQLQKLIEDAPWILHSDWTPLSYNQSLASTRMNFQNWYFTTYGEVVVTSSIDNPGKRPDFVMLNHEGFLEVIDIKRPRHTLSDTEFDRAFGYLTAVRKFIEHTAEVERIFPAVKLTIVCDLVGLDALRQNTIRTDLSVAHKTWHDVLQLTRQRHEDFLTVVRELQGDLPKLSEDGE